MAKNLAIVFGVVFVIVGLLGFVGGLGIVGPTGLFATNLPHDLIHLVSGIVFLIVAFSAPQASSATLKTFGYVYLLVTILGFVLTPSGGSLLGFIQMSAADNYLHLVLAVVILIAGYSASKPSMMATA